MKKIVFSIVSLSLLLAPFAGLVSSADAATCSTYNRNQGGLYAEVNLNAGRSTIHNTTNCSYNVGVASFKIMNKQTGHPQELYDVTYGTVAKHSTLTLRVNVPSCAFQFDTFVGTLGNRQGIDHVNAGRQNLNRPNCKPEQPSPTPTPTCTPSPVYYKPW